MQNRHGKIQPQSVGWCHWYSQHSSKVALLMCQSVSSSMLPLPPCSVWVLFVALSHRTSCKLSLGILGLHSPLKLEGIAHWSSNVSMDCCVHYKFSVAELHPIFNIVALTYGLTCMEAFKYSTRLYKNEINIVFSQLTWKKAWFSKYCKAFYSIETWSCTWEAGHSAKLNLFTHFFPTFYTFNQKTNRWIIGYLWKGTWQQNEKPSKGSRRFCLDGCLAISFPFVLHHALLLQSLLLRSISKWILLVSLQVPELHAVLPMHTTANISLELAPSHLENKYFSCHFWSALGLVYLKGTLLAL